LVIVPSRRKVHETHLKSKKMQRRALRLDRGVYAASACASQHVKKHTDALVQIGAEAG
jgi:hypothetical protein